MILTNELKGIIVSKGFSQREIAEQLGITPRTFYNKMKKGVFNSDEIEMMIKILGIQQPLKIFFAKYVS